MLTTWLSSTYKDIRLKNQPYSTHTMSFFKVLMLCATTLFTIKYLRYFTVYYNHNQGGRWRMEWSNIFVVKQFWTESINLIENNVKIRSRPTVDGDAWRLKDDAWGWPISKHPPTKWLLEMRLCWPTSVNTKVETSGGGTSKSPLNVENPTATAHGSAR